MFKKILLTSICASVAISSAMAVDNSFDEKMQNIVLQKDKKVIEQAEFDKEYLKYLKKKEMLQRRGGNSSVKSITQPGSLIPFSNSK